nr:hypothetical protein [Tanacetum cinerariifolium]
MNPIASQQDALDNSLVALEKRLKIKRCNARIAFTKLRKEETYQFTLEALKLSSCYPAFQITTEVPEIYMHQFWNTIKKTGKTDAYDFKLDKKKYFMYQADNKEISSTRKEHMSYPRFTKFIIDHFIPKDNSISTRNKLNLYTAHDDSLLGALKFFSKTKDYQKYGALIPNGMLNDDINLSIAYKTYLDYAIGKVPPKKERKFKKPASPKEPTQKDAQLKKTLRKSKQETHKLLASGSSEGADFKSEVPDEKTGRLKTQVMELVEDENDDFNDEDNDDGNDDDSGSNDDGDNDVQHSEQTDSDDDENPSFTLKDYKEEEHDEEVSALETKLSDFNQTSQFVEAVSLIPSIDDQYLASKMKEAVDVAEDEMIKKRMKTPLMDQTKEQKEESQARMLNHQKAQSQRNQSHIALPKAPNLSLNLQTPDKPPTPDRAWNKSKSIDSRPPQKWINTIAKAT